MSPRNNQALTRTQLKIENPASSSSNLPIHQVLNKIRSNDKTKRRFREDQIKSLEGTFQSNSRPGSCLKHQLANRLELEPRQVATWFQNKRARLKNKQIECEYSKLKTEYEDLIASFASLKQEHELLLVQKLKSIQGMAEETANLQAEYQVTAGKTRPRHAEECRHNARTAQIGDDGGIAETVREKFAIERAEEPRHDSFASSRSWYSPDSFVNESSHDSKWWELWS